MLIIKRLTIAKKFIESLGIGWDHCNRTFFR